MESQEKEFLKSHFVFEKVDKISNDLETTTFKRNARLHQALWREKKGFPIGMVINKQGVSIRPLGSLLELNFAKQRLSNFLSDPIRSAVKERLQNHQRYQMLDENRLYGNLLSSMPMCFNLFGSLSADLDLANKAIHSWWPDVPGNVCAIRFEWSPGRSIPGLYLENRSAFDVSFELELENGTHGILGIETKYHEDCKIESVPKPEKLRRYSMVAHSSGIFVHNAIDKIIGTDLQQIWLDHLLALSLLQEKPPKWVWAKFVLIHPAKNPSYKFATDRYKKFLKNFSSFEVNTIESLLEKRILNDTITSAFTERYLW